MTILDVLCEDMDWQLGSALQVDTTAGHFRAGFARCAIAAAGFGGIMKSTLFPGGAVTSLWVSCRAFWTNFAFAAQGIGPSLAGTGKGVMFGVDSDVLKLYSLPSLTVLATEAGATFTWNVLRKVDMHIANWGVSAVVHVYVDGILKITWSGDLTFGGTVLNVDSLFGRSGNASALVCSEIVIADGDTRALSVVTNAPARAGTLDQWTGAYTDVNEITLDDSTTANTNTASKDEDFGLTALPAGVWRVEAVKAVARTTTTVSATATKLALGINDAGIVAVGALQTLAAGWANSANLMAVNPATSAPWQPEQFPGLQLVMRSGS